MKDAMDSLQKSMLECKINKEAAERKLEEEIKSRESTAKRLNNQKLVKP